jgi:hypothetical protein
MKLTIAKAILGVFVTLGVGMAFGLKDHTPIVEQKEIVQQVVDSLEQTKDTIPIVKYRTLNWDDFLETIIWVESRGQDSAYNPEENAVGVLQIRPIMVREVNRVLRKHKSDLRFTLDDRWDRQKSIDMFEIMAEEVYCCIGISFREYCEVVARKWNGGGRGHKKKATLEYWQRIENKMNQINLEL